MDASIENDRSFRTYLERYLEEAEQHRNSTYLEKKESSIAREEICRGIIDQKRRNKKTK